MCVCGGGVSLQERRTHGSKEMIRDEKGVLHTEGAGPYIPWHPRTEEPVPGSEWTWHLCSPPERFPLAVL